MIFTVTAYYNFAKKLARQAHLKLGKVEIKKFLDGEIYARITEEVSNRNVYVIGASMPPSDNLVEFLLLINALKIAGARKITAIIPYLGYSRGDHIVKRGEAVSAKLIADILKCAGIDYLITVDIHSPRVVKFLKMPLINIRAQELLAHEILRSRKISKIMNRKDRVKKRIVIVAPDRGALPLAKRMAKIFQTDIAWMEKTRPRPDIASVSSLRGNVKDKIAIIVDDMIDTAGTIVGAFRLLKKAGSKEIIIAATHPIFAGPAISRLKKARIFKIFVTDTVPLTERQCFKKVKIVSVVPLIARVL